jgi:hypothetical protein
MQYSSCTHTPVSILSTIRPLFSDSSPASPTPSRLGATSRRARLHPSQHLATHRNTFRQHRG